MLTASLTQLAAAVDGADQASYAVYRCGGTFELALQNPRAFIRVKRDLGLSTRHICRQYLVFAQHEGRIEEAR